MIDISREDVVRIDGIVVPLTLLRAFASAGGQNPWRVRAEYPDGTCDELEIRPNGSGLDFLRTSIRSQPATDNAPAATEFTAQLVDPEDPTKRQMVTRGSDAHVALVNQGWTETGVTRSKPVPVVVAEDLAPNRAPVPSGSVKNPGRGGAS